MKTVEQLIRESIGDLGVTQKVASRKLDKEEVQKISLGLMKVAELPYNDEAYSSVQGIMKLASTSISSALNELSAVEGKIVKLEKIAEVRQVVDEMLDVGVIGKEDVREKAAELSSKSDRELEITKEALKLGARTSQNIFFEKTANQTKSPSVKSGMFDGIINS